MMHNYLKSGLLLSLGLMAGAANAQTLTGVDVGTPSNPGSVNSTNDTSGNKVYTIVGGGSDIWGTGDNCYFAYTKMTGDFDYIANVKKLVGNTGDGGWSKAELMARQDDGSGSPQAGDSFIANMVTRPSSDTPTTGSAATGSAGVNNIGPQFRSERGGSADSHPSSSTIHPTSANWIRMERVGNVFYLYASTDGKTWSMYSKEDPQGIDTSGSWPPGDSSTVFSNAWPATCLLGLAVTAHSDADTSTATISDFGPYTPTPIALVTQPAATVAVSQNNMLTLSVAATGDPVHYQWRKNGTAIPQAVASTYTVALAQLSDAGTYTVRVFGAGKEIISSSSVVTVTVDTTPPTIAKVNPLGFTEADVTFSEPVTDTALTVGNYALDQGLTIKSVTRLTANSVALTTSTMAQGVTYALTVNGIKDTANPANTIAANTKFSFSAVTFATGFASYQRWNDANLAFADFVQADLDGTHPAADVSLTVAQFGGPWGTGVNNYNSKVSGFFIPPSNGDYIFFLASDDASNLYLSTDDKEANKKMIAQESGWSNQYQWQTVGGGSSADDKRSDTFSMTEWTGNITLKAGQKYYLEILQHQGTGGDGCDATFIKVGDANPSQDVAGDHLVGSAIGTYIDPNGATVNITTQPASVQGVDGKSVSFSVVADTFSPLVKTPTYQWYKNGTAIAGATLATYSTPVALADNNAKFTVAVSVPGLTKTSDAANLTVVADTFPPVASASAVKNQAGSYDVGVGFDEAIDPVEAGKQANYTLSGGTVTGFKALATGVILTTTGLTPGTQYTVTVKNVADVKGNKITSTNVTFTVGKMAWGVVGADTLQLGNGVIAVNDNGFDVYSDGNGEWGQYDEATLVYEEITGNFDKKIRVEYQESSSQWARAGLIARDVTNFGVDQATQEGSKNTAPPYDGKAGRYQKVHVNPVTTAMGTAGNNAYEGNRRTITGAATTSAGGSSVPPPAYPHAWCRLQRVGQTITIYRSDDGVTWTQLGATTWPDSADTDNTLLPDKLYVGIDYSPENGNVTDQTPVLRRMFYAQFRDYGDTFANKPTLSAKRNGTNLTITYTGTLLSAPKVSGPWTAVTGASSPYAAPISTGQMFFKSSQ